MTNERLLELRAELQPFATVYYFDFDDRPVRIAKEDGKWTVMWRVGGMNYWYLKSDGWWRYKAGSSWTTPEEALATLKAYHFDHVDSIKTPAPR